MKVSVSLPDEDVAFLDQHASRAGSSRSAVIREALRLLREQSLEEAYAAALDEWETGPDAAFWSGTEAAPPLTAVGVVRTGGRARRREYLPDERR
ncbi:MAG: CopG family transcriptional regulator [Candidatus Dormibacteraeota bacterium]|nr:CopG family transcriptional regulator [Candidatus Dormibacteraeota bacterium]